METAKLPAKGERKQIIAINPGSTSTKVALFYDDEKIFSVNIEHPDEELGRFEGLVDQQDYRMEAILKAFEERGVDLSQTDAFSGRCTGLLSMPGGVFEVNDVMYEHGGIGPGSKHPGNLGPRIARDLSRRFGGMAVVVNPSSIDEFWLNSRPLGLKDMYRTSRDHPLNQKEVARRYAHMVGKPYEKLNLVIAHMGGGISVTAHMKGKMVDCIDGSRGEGRMAPTRSGMIPAADMVDLCFSGRYTKKELITRVMKKGGWIDWLGTSDAREVERRIDDGDKLAKAIYEATAYQIGKDIGAMAAAMSFKVDAILLTGGLAHSTRFCGLINKMVCSLAPVSLFPGEYEMEGLAAGALRALRGEAELHYYTGEPVFKGIEA